jgi:hypothetical protein
MQRFVLPVEKRSLSKNFLSIHLALMDTGITVVVVWKRRKNEIRLIVRRSGYEQCSNV